MLFNHKLITAAIVGFFVSAALTANGQSADNARFLSLAPAGGMPIIPVMEGWIANPDGTTSFSFGVINRNEEAVEIPLGEGNYIEPAQFDGGQPTHFPAGRSVGCLLYTSDAADE